MFVGENRGEKLFIYMYDANGSPIGYQYRESTYAADVWDTFWFDKNLFGDIVAVYDEDGTSLVYYVYDAWGSK